MQIVKICGTIYAYVLKSLEGVPKSMKNTFILAILAGFCIGLGGTVYLSVDNPVVGAALFSIGLLTILAFGFNLFTGKVGYALDNPPSYIWTLLVIWLGNFVGTWAMAMLVRCTRVYDKLAPKVKGIVEAKLNDDLLSILFLAIGCGMCMYIAVDQYRKRTSMVRALFVIFPVMVFILCSFEHCIANMYYFSLAGALVGKTYIYLAVMTLGNAVGGLIIPALTKLTAEKK